MGIEHVRAREESRARLRVAKPLLHTPSFLAPYLQGHKKHEPWEPLASDRWEERAPTARVRSRDAVRTASIMMPGFLREGRTAGVALY
jgi:hypothetical protein